MLAGMKFAYLIPQVSLHVHQNQGMPLRWAFGKFNQVSLQKRWASLFPACWHFQWYVMFLLSSKCGLMHE